MEPELIQKWLRAQEEERKHHGGTLEEGVKAYGESYAQYFEHLGMTFDQKGKTIIEIGPADVPAMFYCRGYEKGHIIEPMPSEILQKLVQHLPIDLYETPAEHMTFPKVDEIWLLNVLQHTMDPDLIIEKCKDAAKVVRFFEPINDHIDVCHLHSFSLEFFQKHFGECVKYYEDHKGRVVNFHEHECAYGVWTK
jgi:hypothetical protein